VLQIQTLKHKLELEKTKAGEFMVQQEWNSHEIELKAHVVALQMCVDAS
jgi:hypothetical protein